MTEAGFHLFNKVFSVVAEGIYAVLLTAFFYPFLINQPETPFTARSSSRFGQRGKLLLLFAAYFLFALLCDRAALPQGSFSLMLMALLLAISQRIGLSKPLVFLLTLLYCNARISSGLMVESLYFVIERLLSFHMERMEQLEAVFLRAAFLITLFLLSHTVLMTGMLYALQRQMRKQRFPLHQRELCYLSLIPLAGILFGQVISRLLIEVKDGALLQLYERHPAFLAIVPVLALLFYVGTYVTIVFQQGMAALREKQATHYVEYQQTRAIQARIHEVEQSYRRIRQLKHEMRGHLTNIKGLARSGQYASLESYIARMDESLNDFDLTFQTGNPVTDVIVNDKRQQCQEAHIRFEVSFHYPEPSADRANGANHTNNAHDANHIDDAYDAFAIGIILQNLLQNALEACEKIRESEQTQERWITLAGRQKGRFFLIEVRNTCAGEVTLGADGLPVTTKKENLPLHGLGLSNVRREAEKYQGGLEWKASPHEFSATVLLQERSYK